MCEIASCRVFRQTSTSTAWCTDDIQARPSQKFLITAAGGATVRVTLISERGWSSLAMGHVVSPRMGPSGVPGYIAREFFLTFSSETCAFWYTWACLLADDLDWARHAELGMARYAALEPPMAVTDSCLSLHAADSRAAFSCDGDFPPLTHVCSRVL